MVEKVGNREEDDEISIDFGKIKNWFKGFGKKSRHKTSNFVKEDKDDEVKVDWNKVSGFFSKNKVWLLLLIPIILSVFFRIQPVYLPMTDTWADSTIGNYYRSQISTQINQQYPNLPDENKNVLIAAQLEDALEKDRESLKEQKKQLSQQYKAGLQDENGHTYLLAIDPYFWYAHARNYVNNGFMGDEIVDGKESFSLRNGREPMRVVTIPFNSYVGAWAYKVLSVFNKDLSLMRVMFFIPLVIVTLAIIPAFFIAKRVGGNLAGLFAGIIVATNSALLGRTPAGFADTDGYNILFPLMITWMIFLSIESKDNLKRGIFASIGGIFVGLYSITWGGWWYVFDFILATLGVYLIYLLIRKHYTKVKESFTQVKNLLMSTGVFFVGSFLFVGIFQGFDAFLTFLRGPLSVIVLKDVAVTTVWPNVLTTVAEFNETTLGNIIPQMGGIIFFMIALIGILIISFKDEMGKINWSYVVSFAAYYLVLIIGVSSKNIIILSDISRDILSRPLLFILLLGLPVAVGLIKSKSSDVKYSIFIIIWVMGTTYGFTKGVRFAILMVPGFAIAFGICISFLFLHASRWFAKEFNVNKNVTNSIFIILVVLLFIAVPVQSEKISNCSLSGDKSFLCQTQKIAKNEMPSMDDAWYNSLKAIGDESEDAIITSWWDFGHWFYSISERRVTFDGADQGERIHWVGKSLLVSDEKLAVGILRMLNCGQEKPPHVLEEYLDGDTVRAVDILNEIVVLDKDEAKEVLEREGLSEDEVESVLEVTHCDDLIDSYYITSEDMIRKSGVWGHFGSWDFKRASMYQNVVKKNYDEGVGILKDEFGLSQEEAETTFYEIKNNKADQWVSPWPSYASDLVSCSEEEGIIKCNHGMNFDLENGEAWADTAQGKMYPKYFVWADLDGLNKKEYSENIIKMQNGRDMAAALVPTGGGNYRSFLMDGLLADSVFTRLFFFKGHGSKYFKLFKYDQGITGVDIYVWKVDWDEGDPIIMDELLGEPEIRASHILICGEGDVRCTANRTKEEAKVIADDLLQRVNETNFEELAIEYSDGPSGPRGGDLGWFGKGRMVPAFEKAAFALEEVNKSTVMVETDFGYHIIKLTGKKSALEIAKEKQELEKKIEEFKEEQAEEEIVENLTETNETE